MSAFHDVILAGASGSQGYQISRSVRLRSSASAYFNRTPASAGNRKTWTWSGWVKRGVINTTSQYQTIFTGGTSTATASSLFYFGFWDTNGLRFSSGTVQLGITTAVFRDPSAWYHIVVAVDTTQATADNRIKVYVNGVQITMTVSNLAQNDDTGVNATTQHSLGQVISSQYLDGYLTEVNFIDGQALTPSSFGETDSITGVWKPKKYAGTYGTNGFYLNFSDNSAATAAAIGKDYSGNGNNWTPNNISVTAGATYDSMLDVPTLYADGGNGRGNYAVLNPISATNQVRGTIADGNLTGTVNTTAPIVISTFEIPTNLKIYVEFTATSGISSAAAGLTDVGVRGFNDNYTQADAATYLSDARKTVDGVTTSYGATYTNANVIGMAIDAANKTVEFFKDGATQGVVTWSTTYTTLYVGISARGGTAGARTGSINFGQRPFAYTPPTGFKALNTQNLPEPTIKKGNQYFDATTYTGNGSTQSIVNSAAMQPDLVWLKTRSTVSSNLLYDSVRGALNYLSSNQTAAEATLAGSLTAFNSNGFSLGSDSNTNGNGTTFVGWQWKESVTAGFDIVTYTGTGANRTVAHSLGVAPAMMIVKNRTDGTTDWRVWHSALAGTEFLALNTTAAKATGLTQWNSTVPTSTVFSLGTATATNGSGHSLVAYLFAEVAGFSKFGSFTGNGSADGPFIFTGFQPRFIMIKRTDTTSNWIIKDTARSSYNVGLQTLYPNLSNAEAAGESWDATSNGVKIRSTSTEINASGGTYIYAAFSEVGFKYALGR